MASITIKKGGQDFVYSSLADACKQNGSTTAKNRVNAIKYLEKCGFDMTDISKSSDTKPRATMIERIINECKTIDKAHIDDLTKQVMELVRKMKKASDIEPIQAIQDAIEKAQNPIVSRKMVLDKVGAWYDAHTQVVDKQETDTQETQEEETA